MPMQAVESWQVIVIGAGIAGASVAAELATLGARVLLLEREDRPAYHTTGRSAALFTVAYGPPVIRALSRASEPAFRDGAPLLRPRGAMFLARPDQQAALDAMAAEVGPAVEPITAQAAREWVPVLHPDYLAAALVDASAADIDVDALHGGYLRRLTTAGGVLRCKAGVTGIARDGAGWRVQAGGTDLRADILVNAAGAWADELAAAAGVARVGLVPKRRTALLVAPPPGVVIDAWPLAVDVDEQFYVKPDAGMLMLSPADETPSPPCDAAPDEMDVAIAIDRVQGAMDLPVRRVAHKWAGLRSFVADKSPVVGFAPGAPGFFWLAGQGGYGIQSAPALSRWAAAAVLGLPAPADIADHGVTPAPMAPDRIGLAA